MATTVEPRRPRLLWCNDPLNPMLAMEVVMGFGEETLKWVLKKEVGEEIEGERTLVKVGKGLDMGLMIMVLEELIGVLLKICKPISTK